jgi:hypothetical protein
VTANMHAEMYCSTPLTQLTRTESQKKVLDGGFKDDPYKSGLGNEGMKFLGDDSMESGLSIGSGRSRFKRAPHSFFMPTSERFELVRLPRSCRTGGALCIRAQHRRCLDFANKRACKPHSDLKNGWACRANPIIATQEEIRVPLAMRMLTKSSTAKWIQA